METQHDRQAKGAAQLASLIGYWMKRSGLSQRQFTSVLDWGLRERCTLHNSGISRIINGQQPRGAGLKHLDALAQGNEVIWAWHVLGKDAALKRHGPFSSWGVEEQWIERAVWMPRPDDDREPLDLGDFAMVTAGRMLLPYLDQEGHAQRLTEALLGLLEGIRSEHGWNTKEMAQQMVVAYPSGEGKRQQWLKALLVGDAQLEYQGLDQQLSGLAEMVRRIRGLETYGPTELELELSAGDHQACG
jgi:hypothetical protein